MIFIMENIFYLILLILFIFASNNYDYSSYIATSINKNLFGNTLKSTNSDESVVYINNSEIIIQNSILEKTSGNSSNTKTSNLYGINSALLVNGGNANISGSTISTAVNGANAVFATNKGNITITGSKISSFASSSAGGLYATNGGTINAKNVNITSNGTSSPSLATDINKGTITCIGCLLSTKGSRSPLIYSIGNIDVIGSKGFAQRSQMVVVDGQNTVTIRGNSNLKCTGFGQKRNNSENSGIALLHTDFEGCDDVKNTIFNCKHSSMEIISASPVYKSAPMFFVKNADVLLNLENCKFRYGSGVFLDIRTTAFRDHYKGAFVTMTITNQYIEGDFVVDTNSSLSINLINSTIIGKINNNKVHTIVAILIDAASSIVLTGDSYISHLTNEDETLSNIKKGPYILADFTGYEFHGINLTNLKSNNTSSHNYLYVAYYLLIILLLLL